MRLAAIFLLIPSFLQAQDFNDYGRIFQENAAQVVVTRDIIGRKSAILSLPNGIDLERFGSQGDYHYQGTDSSEGGAVGCLFMIASELADIVAHCDMSVPKDQKADLDGVLRDIATFVATNSVPPLPVEKVMERLGQNSRYKDGTACEQARSSADVTTMLAALSGEAARRRIAKSLSVPRLPVANPCL